MQKIKVIKFQKALGSLYLSCYGQSLLMILPINVLDHTMMWHENKKKMNIQCSICFHCLSLGLSFSSVGRAMRVNTRGPGIDFKQIWVRYKCTTTVDFTQFRRSVSSGHMSLINSMIGNRCLKMCLSNVYDPLFGVFPTELPPVAPLVVLMVTHLRSL